jgi:hypothetical protein
LTRKLSVLSLIVGLVALVVYRMAFSPVSMAFESQPAKILASSSIPIVVEVFPLNRLGLRIPFKHLDGRFVVIEGRDKIEIVKTGGDLLIFKTRDKVGRLTIFYYADRLPIPMEIILNIETTILARQSIRSSLWADYSSV